MIKFLAELPSTNFRIAITMALVTVTVLTVCGGLILEKEMPIDVLIALFTFETGLAGVDYFQFSKKRETHQPAPPARPDIEDAPKEE